MTLNNCSTLQRYYICDRDTRSLALASFGQNIVTSCTECRDFSMHYNQVSVDTHKVPQLFGLSESEIATLKAKLNQKRRGRGKQNSIWKKKTSGG